MHLDWRRHRRTLYAMAAAIGLSAALWLAFRPSALQREANRVQKEVAAIRGVDFANTVPVERVSREQWREFVLREYRKAPMFDGYWQIVGKLGLYRGPDLGDPEKVFVDLLAVAGGAYDPAAKKFLLLVDLDGAGRDVVFAHELYHAWQDREFDLERYVVAMERSPDANADEVMARRSVVEGEATYIDTLFQVKAEGLDDPTPEQMQEFIAVRGNFDLEQWKLLLANPDLEPEYREIAQHMVDAYAHAPRFLLDMLLSPYTDGMPFIHAVVDRGWDQVVKLYLKYPPVSTEQILHPEKWFAREAPATIRWPPFDSEPLFAEWALLLENTMGELQWRMVLREQGLEGMAQSVAAGWNGDRYAVFRNRSSNELLLLVFTTWDTEQDAEEFERAYPRVLASKYGARPIAWRMRRLGRDVCIVEGGSEQTVDAFMAFNSRQR